MPHTPKGHKRPADVIGNAVTVMKIAMGEIEESGQTDDGKSKAAVELGRKGGLAVATVAATIIHPMIFSYRTIPTPRGRARKGSQAFPSLQKRRNLRAGTN